MFMGTFLILLITFIIMAFIPTAIIAGIVFLIIKLTSKPEKNEQIYYKDGKYYRVDGPQNLDSNGIAQNSAQNVHIDNNQTLNQFPNNVNLNQPQNNVTIRKPKDSSDNGLMFLVLLIAGVLIITSISMFIESIQSAQYKFIALAIFILLFYVAGLAIFKLYEKLRIVANSLIWISISALPFLGVAMTYLLDKPAEISWLAMSFVAMILYVYATVFTRSSSISYMALMALVSFVASISYNASTGLNDSLFWVLASLILVSIICQIVYSTFKDNLPEYSVGSIASGSLLSICASIIGLSFLFNEKYFNAEVLVGLSLVQYIFYFVQTKRYFALCLARFLLSVFIVVLGFHSTLLTDEKVAFISSSIILAGVVQQFISFYLYDRVKSVEYKKDAEYSILNISLAVQWITVFMLMFGRNYSLTICSILFLLMSVPVIYYQKLKDTRWLYGSLAAIALFPLFAKSLLFEQLKDQTAFVSWVYILMAVVALMGYIAIKKERFLRKWLGASMAAFSILAIFVGMIYSGTIEVVGVNLELLLPSLFLAYGSYLGVFRVKKDEVIKEIFAVIGTMFVGLGVYQLIAPTFKAPDETLNLIFSSTAATLVAIFFAEGLRLRGSRINESVFRIAGATTSLVAFSFVTLYSSNSGEFTFNHLVLALLQSFLVLSIGIVQYLRSHSVMSIRLIIVACYMSLYVILKYLKIDDELLHFICTFELTIIGALALIATLSRNRKELFVFVLAISSFILCSVALLGSGAEYGGFYQFLFLIQHVIMLAFGAISQKRWLIIWGAVAILLSVLFIFRDIPFLSLFLAGVSLISLVSYLIIKNDNKNKPHQP